MKILIEILLYGCGLLVCYVMAIIAVYTDEKTWVLGWIDILIISFGQAEIKGKQ
jgi:hypothetical protein